MTINQKDFQKIAVMGAGAVGCYYGALLSRAGRELTLIARPAHAEAINQSGLWFESSKQETGFVPMTASTDPAAIAGTQLLLLAVKTGDTEATAELMAPHLPPDAPIVVLQNGVDNVRRVQAALPNPVIPAVVYVAAAMSGPGRLKHNGAGSLVIGQPTQSGKAAPVTDEVLAAVASTMETAGIKCPIDDNIDGKLWFKLAINCAFNAISALGQANYAHVMDTPQTRQAMQDSIMEVEQVAKASGIRIDADDLFATILRAGDTMREATSSTEQDLRRGKLTEIDELNGFIARRGEALGVPTPVNKLLHALVKLRETGLGLKA